jgi:hypothetical protein
MVCGAHLFFLSFDAQAGEVAAAAGRNGTNFSQ